MNNSQRRVDFQIGESSNYQKLLAENQQNQQNIQILKKSLQKAVSQTSFSISLFDLNVRFLNDFAACVYRMIL